MKLQLQLIKSALTLVLLTVFLSARAQNNVGIGTTTPNSKAILELKATDKGFIAPRMNTVQMNAIAPTTTEASLLVYNTDSACYHFYNGTAWKSLCQKSLDTALINKAIKQYLNSNATTIINILKGDTSLFNYTTINNAIINILTVDTSITNVAIINNATINLLKVDTSITNVATINQANINIANIDTSITNVANIGISNTNLANINNAIIDSSITNYANINNLAVDSTKANFIQTNTINSSTFNGGFSNMDSLYIGGQNITKTITDSIAAQAWLLKGNNAPVGNKLGTLNARDLHIVANNQEKITIANTTGFVGINQAVPTQHLDVAGNLKFDLALMPNGIAGTNGDILVSQGALLAPQWQNGSTLGSTLNNVSWSLLGNSGTNPNTNFLGTTDNKSLRFRTNNTEKMIVDSMGNVGINTATPTAKLQVTTSEEWGVRLTSDNNILTHRNHFLAQRSNSGAAILLNQTLGGVAMGGYNGSIYTNGWNGGVEISGMATENWTLTNNGSAIDFNTTTNGSTSIQNRVRIDQNGNVGIGTTNPIAPLHVNSTASAPNGNFAITNGIKYLSHNEVGAGSYNPANNGNIMQSIVFSNDGGNATVATGGLSIVPHSATLGGIHIMENGRVGIGTDAPTEKLEVNGAIKITDGTQGVGKVLTSDATGKANWQTPSGGYRQSYRLQAAQSFPNGVPIIMNFPTVTTPYTGFYLINFKSFLNVPITAEYSYYIAILINGVVFSNDETYQYCEANRYLNVTDVYTINANAGDVITLRLTSVIGLQTMDAPAAGSLYDRNRFDLIYLGK